MRKPSCLTNALFNCRHSLKMAHAGFSPFLMYYSCICVYISVWGTFKPILSFCLSGGVPAADGGEQGEGVPYGPEQHWWSAGHVHVGRASWGRHHAQPSSAVPKRLHLCKTLRDTEPHNAPWVLIRVIIICYNWNNCVSVSSGYLSCPLKNSKRLLEILKSLLHWIDISSIVICLPIKKSLHLLEDKSERSLWMLIALLHRGEHGKITKCN